VTEPPPRPAGPLPVVAACALLGCAWGCGGGAAVGEPDAGEAEAAPLSYVSRLLIPLTSGGVPTCCKDFGEISKDHIEDGTARIDNALALLAEGLGELGLSMQDIIDDAFLDGVVVLLYEHQGLGDPADSAFTLVELAGSFAGSTSHEEAAAGAGVFEIDPRSFDPITGEPRSSAAAAAAGGRVSAGPYVAHLAVPMPPSVLEVRVSAAELAGTIAVSEAGVTYSQATFSGYVLLDDLFGAMNAAVTDPSCACLGLDGPVYVADAAGAWSASCVAGAQAACPNEEEALCVTLAGDDGLCPDTTVVFEGLADIELDPARDGYEALSVGFTWSGVPATLAR
jgi:hypothetical protein